MAKRGLKIVCWSNDPDVIAEANRLAIEANKNGVDDIDIEVKKE